MQFILVINKKLIHLHNKHIQRLKEVTGVKLKGNLKKQIYGM